MVMAQVKSQDQAIKERLAKASRRTSVTFLPEPAKEKLFCPIISVDDHSLEPFDLFQRRLPARMAAEAPHVIEGPDGRPWWVVGEAEIPLLMVNGASGRPVTEWQSTASALDEMRRGVWDTRARLDDMDITGTWAQLCFGSVTWGFAGGRFADMRDPEVGLACLRAYNDWHIEEWCGSAPERFIPCQLPWMADPNAAAEEVYRNAGRGFRSVSFSENPAALGYPSIYGTHWEPFLRACEETQTVVNLHVGSSGTTRKPSEDSMNGVVAALFPLSGIETLVDWVFANIPVRFPKLTVALSEAGVSWVPMALERLRRAERMAGGPDSPWPAGHLSAEEVVANTFVFTSIEDHAGFRLLDMIGQDRVMVETDYPHMDSTWPLSQAMVRSELEGLDPTVIRKVCYENAARTYRHPLPPAEMIAASEVGFGTQAEKLR
jgi:predicted TIM-barrel fold metal-dependent hydrolase